MTTQDRRSGDEPAEPVDTVSFVTTFAGGAAGIIDASLISPGRKNMLAWEINCSRGSVAWDLEQLNVLRVHRRGAGPVQGFTDVNVTETDHALARPWWPSAHLLGWEHGHANMLAHFVEAVAGDRDVAPHAATFDDGLRAAEVAEAVRRSAESGERVAVAGSGWKARTKPATLPRS